MLMRNIVVPIVKLGALVFVAKKLLDASHQLQPVQKKTPSPPSSRRPRPSPYLADGRDRITVAAEDSFPASDPPAWTPTTIGHG